jgi:beta-glucosidase
MAQATFHFPRGFLWGTATAAHQVEGNNTSNNWWAWEQEEGRIIHGQKSGLACDWWSGRWREDFDRAAETGQNAHRLSIEWSRVQPAPDRWDEQALDHYVEMMRGLYERGMTPMVTLHHFSDPLWLAEKGGWDNEAVIEYFVKYASKVVEAMRDYVTLWVTINEPNVLATNAYLFGNFPPGKNDLRATLRVMVNLARAHAAAYQAIHKIQPHARVGIAVNYRGMLPANKRFPPDSWAVSLQSGLYNSFFPRALDSGVLYYPAWKRRLPEAKGTQDFLGINYYTRDLVSFNLLKAGELFGHRFFLPNDELSESGFIANVPEVLFQVLKWALQFKVPILVTENGVEDSKDNLRPRYLIQHLHQIWRGVNFNYPIKGYFHWTLVDNFEWERGWTQRFGLWELDVETQTRHKRPSADLYAEICRENGISSETVARFAPQLVEKMFPN